MPNIVSFPKSEPRSTPHPAAGTEGGHAVLVRLVAELEASVRQEISVSLLALDLATYQARRMLLGLRDPAVKAGFEAQVAMIEKLLQVARVMTLKL
jgi:hypothetical protein